MESKPNTVPEGGEEVMGHILGIEEHDDLGIEDPTDDDA